MGISPEELETHQATAADDDSEYEDVETIATDKLREANGVLKRASILLFYLSDPFTKTITNRERTIIDKHTDAMTNLISEIEEFLEDEGVEEDA